MLQLLLVLKLWASSTKINEFQNIVFVGLPGLPFRLHNLNQDVKGF